MTGTPQATLVGGPTVVLEYAGLTFLTDPTFDPPGKVGNLTKLEGPALSHSDIGHIDVVLLSHDEHEDNLDVSGRTVLDLVPHVLTTPSGGTRIGRAQGMRRWDQAIIPGGASPVTITAVPARHGPSVIKHLTGQVTGFVLEAEGWPTIYISGDNSSVKKVTRVAERFPDVSIAIIFAGGARVERLGDMLLTVDAERVSQIAGLWPDAAVYPVHIDDWAHFAQPRADLVAWFEDAGQLDTITLLERGVRTPLPAAVASAS
ncbi:MBL fold metallo-hydrolase [Demequina muriae]|uniref:MBL fold metallo-hydrolase n=1 Tax=Demequina muriae TaxID=3051664 RepID=A0ABT8GI25_9MICO|nr:MBL fold metallo-hydrolase [Demequina sp. EGI L300058]MDN4481085.1 MBL fold metallo-hydrolase [Demequina sp. EGI L300058]